MKKPLQKLVCKLLIYILILLAGLAFGAVNTTGPYGMVLPSLLTVFATVDIYHYVKDIRKAKNKSKIEFK